MPVIDITLKNTEADARFNSFKAKRDGKDDDAIIYECDLVFPIRTQEEARTLQNMVPGAEDIWVRAQHPDDNWKFSVTAKPELSVRVEIAHAKKGKVAIKGGCEVRSIGLRASKKAVAATFKLAFGGQTALAATKLTEVLGEAVAVIAEMTQQILPFATGGVQPEVGQVIVSFDPETEEHFVGQVKSVADGGESYILDDFGADYAVAAGSVISNFTLTGDTKALLRSYKQRCKRRELAPSWEAMVLAIAEHWDGALRGGSGSEFELTGEHIESAVARIETGNAAMPVSASQSATA